MNDIPWHRDVELLAANGCQADLRVARTKMPLGDALEAFLNLPAHEQISAGIGFNEPVRMTVNGREAMVGWYNAEACHALAKMVPNR